jgi:hypothetical protein
MRLRVVVLANNNASEESIYKLQGVMLQALRILMPTALGTKMKEDEGVFQEETNSFFEET